MSERKYILTNLDTLATKEVKVAGGIDIEERYFRSTDYNSVLRSDTLPIKFPKHGGRLYDYGGYYFLLDAKDSKGVRARVQLDVYKKNPYTNAYEKTFTGVLSFNPDSGYTQEDEFISIKVEDSQKLAKFISRDEIEYDVFSLESSDNVTVTDFSSSYNTVVYNPVDIYLRVDNNSGNFSGGEDAHTGLDDVKIPLQITNVINEIGERNNIADDGFYPTDDLPQTIYTNNLAFGSTLTNIVFSADVYCVFLFIPNAVPNNAIAEIGIYLTVYDSTDVLVSSQFIYYEITKTVVNLPILATTSDIIDEAINVDVPNIDVPMGGYVQLNYDVGFQSVNQMTLNFANTTTNVIFNYYELTDGYKDTQIRGLYPFETISRLLQLSTSETDTNQLLDSAILGRTDSEFTTYASDGLLSRFFTTNGFQLRQFVFRAVNINFKQYFQTLDSISPIGFWYDKVNDIFIIEDIEEFYKAELFPVSLGQVKDIKTTDFKDVYFNTINSGYPKIEYEDFQGVNEVNTETTHELSFEIKSIGQYRAGYNLDTIGQELSRRFNIGLFASQDTKYDNTIFLTKCNTSDETIQGAISDAEGFVGIELYYNQEESPRQNLQRQSPILSSPLYKDTTKYINFRKSVKDTNISYTDPETGDSVNEFDNITNFTALRAALIDPVLREFEGLYTEEIANEIKTDPHRIMYYTDKDNNTLYGYVWDITGNRAKGTATYKLIDCNPNRVP